MEPNRKTEKDLKIPRWIVSIVITLGIIILLFWTIFYSPFVANIIPIISFRSWYQDTFWKAEKIIKPGKTDYSHFNSVYIIKAEKIRDGQRRYSLFGNFVSIDPANKLLTVRAMDKRNYTFDISGSLSYLENGYLNIDTNLLNDDYQTRPYPNTEQLFHINNEPYTPNTLFHIFWIDNRPLIQILLDYEVNRSKPINSNGPIISLTKYD